MKRKKIRSKRFLAIGLIFSIAFTVLVSRLIYVMMFNGESYKKLAKKQWTKTIKIASKRGSILGKNGSELALSTDVFRIDVDLNVFKKYLIDKKISQKEAAYKLSQELNVKNSEVEKTLESKDSRGNLLQFVFLKRKVGKEVVDHIKALKYDGIIISRDVDRAMANAPDYNLNKPYAEAKTDGEIPEIWKNRAISNVVEPGSIFKVITAAAALQNNVVRDNDIFVNDGSIKIGNTTLYNDNKENYGVETFSDIIKNSDNVGFVNLSQRIGKDKLYKFTKKAGFGQKTHIDLPGESSGLIKNLKNIGPIDLATMSYGQGIAVTQVQYIAAFNAVANGGTWVKPHVMKEISHMASGKRVVDKKYDNFDKKTITSKEKAAKLRTYLEKVVEDGTASDTYMKGYHIAGKTGTANKVNNTTGGYDSGKYITSFAGMAPASDPKVTLIVTIEEPNSEKYYAAQTAVPAAHKLFSKLFTMLDILPDNAK